MKIIQCLNTPYKGQLTSLETIMYNIKRKYITEFKEIRKKDTTLIRKLQIQNKHYKKLNLGK